MRIVNTTWDIDSIQKAFSELESHLERAVENERNTDIDTVYGSNPRSRDGSTHQELLQKLYGSSHYHFKNSHSQRIDGTCEWFTSHPRFHLWRDSEPSSLLWVTGEPGCGKSVLSRYLADEVLRNLSLCYFFFKADTKRQNTAEDALCCILRQLLEQRPQLLSDRILQLLEDDGDRIRVSIRRLWRILILATSRNKASQIVCILDGLDECQEESRRLLVDTLNAFFAEGRTTPRLKVLITSRTLSHSERRLYKPTSTIHLGRDPQSDFGSLGAEIDLAVSHRLTDLRTKLNLTKSEQRRLAMEIKQVPERTHLLVFLILEYLVNSSGQVKGPCTNLPTTIDEAYEKILTASPRPMKTRKLLQIIMAAVRPLTLIEMAVALAVEEGHTSQSELDIEPDDHFRRTLQRLCGPLVSVIDGRVYLFHHTLKKFLIQEDTTNSSSETSLARQATDGHKWSSSISSNSSSNMLGRICAQYLLFTDVEDYFQNPLGNIEKLRTKPLEGLSENYPFLGYAWENWAVHSRTPLGDDGDADSQMQQMLQLCSPRRLSTLIWLRRKWGHPKLDSEDVTRLIVASYLGLSSVTQHLLRLDTTEPNVRDGIFGRSALSWAAGGGFEAVIKTFIDTQRAAKRRSWLERLLGTGVIQVDSKSKPPRTLSISHRPCTPLGWAVRFGHETAVDQLIATNQVKIDEKMLFDAARGGYLGIMEGLLGTGQVRVDARDLFKRTLLSHSSEYGHAGVVKYLLSIGGFDIDARDVAGRTAVTYAARAGEDEVLELLLATGKVDVDCEDQVHRTPLCYAAEQGQDICVGLLLSTGKTDVNRRDERGETPLSLAVGQGKEACVKLLLATGKANLDTEDYMGRTPLGIALIRGFEGCAALLEQQRGTAR
ncbi:NACHT domain-containing protein [Fusarium sp. LHS14.1]|nr:NACHT domain-containing protein [Fusarium sp. LHS14.1]